MYIIKLGTWFLGLLIAISINKIPTHTICLKFSANVNLAVYNNTFQRLCSQPFLFLKAHVKVSLTQQTMNNDVQLIFSVIDKKVTWQKEEILYW